MPERRVISNTSPLLYLHQVGQLDLLRQLYGQVIVPPAVQIELGIGAERGFSTPVVRQIPWLIVRAPADVTLLPMVVDLGQGEAEAIALALETPESLLILDDALGRRIAHVGGLRFTGTLGVLVKAKKEGHLAAVQPVLGALRHTTMHLTPNLITWCLKEAGEV